MINIEIFQKYFVCKKDTSYKLYFGKSLLYFAQKNIDIIDFYELGCMMISVSYKDIERFYTRKRKHDRLLDSKKVLQEKVYINDNNDFYTNYEKIKNVKDKETTSYIYSLVEYVPYRFLSYGQWNKILKGLFDYQKNELIEQLSKESYYNDIYFINKKKIIFNKKFLNDVEMNFEKYLNFINNEIEKYFS